MKKCVALVLALSTVVGTSAAMAQTAPSDTVVIVTEAKPAASAEAVPLTAGAYRYASIMGGWLTPSGDFSDIAGSGWCVMVQGYQFINPMRQIAIGSEVGYQSFGKKNGVGFSNFPVDGVLKVFFGPQKRKTRAFGQAGMGFNYTRYEVGLSTTTDYNFGTQAGGGLELHTNGPVALTFDAVYHWVFASGPDPNFLALRGGLMVPLTAK